MMARAITSAIPLSSRRFCGTPNAAGLGTGRRAAGDRCSTLIASTVGVPGLAGAPKRGDSPERGICGAVSASRKRRERRLLADRGGEGGAPHDDPDALDRVGVPRATCKRRRGAQRSADARVGYVAADAVALSLRTR